MLVATLRDGAITPGRGLVAILISLCSKKKSSLSFSEFATWGQSALEQLAWEQPRERLDGELERPSCEFSCLFFYKSFKRPAVVLSRGGDGTLHGGGDLGLDGGEDLRDQSFLGGC